MLILLEFALLTLKGVFCQLSRVEEMITSSLATACKLSTIPREKREILFRRKGDKRPIFNPKE